MNPISLKLRSLRKDKNLTQHELAQKTGVSRASIANYESGRVIPPADIYIHIVEYLVANPPDNRT